MQIRRCMCCMQSLQPYETFCPKCGRPYGQIRMLPFALRPGTVLDGKYLVGELLGQGGFGITYIGFDLLLEQKVAIKEYYPVATGAVSRDPSVPWMPTGTHESPSKTRRLTRRVFRVSAISPQGQNG